MKSRVTTSKPRFTKIFNIRHIYVGKWNLERDMHTQLANSVVERELGSSNYIRVPTVPELHIFLSGSRSDTYGM